LVKVKALYTVSEVLWTLIQQKLDPQTIRNWYSRRQHTCHVQDEFV